MQEQAERVNNLGLLRCSGKAIEPLRRPSIRTIAVVSGKGGVGKSTLVANLGLALQECGRKVLLVDGDWGMANIDLLLGLSPRFTLHHVALGERKPTEVVVESREGLQLLPGAAGVEEIMDLDDLRCERLLCSLVGFEDRRDLILLDTTSGVGRTTTHLALAADEIILVTTPEPTATADAYACLRVLSRTSGTANVWLVVNRARHLSEATEIAERLRTVAKRFLGLVPEFLGFLPEDEEIGTSVRMQEPFLRLHPQRPAARSIQQIAERLATVPEPEPQDVPVPDRFRKVSNMENAPASRGA
jgi:flagellar biosynthesis protein FlhG